MSDISTTDCVRVADATGLSQAEPKGLGPSGFDPSRFGSWICGEVMSIDETAAVNRAMYDRWVSMTDTPAPLSRNDSGWADVAAIAILCLRHLRDSDGSPKGEDAKRLSPEGVAARAEGIANPPSGAPQ